MHEALLRELDEECSLRSVRLEGPIAIAESIAPADVRPRKHVVHLIFARRRCRRPVRPASPPRTRRCAATSWCRSRSWRTFDLRPPIHRFLERWTPGDPFVHLGQLWAR